MNNAALSDVCQKLQSTIEARFAAAIGRVNDIEWIERDPDGAQRTIAGDCESRQHDASAWIRVCGLVNLGPSVFLYREQERTGRRGCHPCLRYVLSPMSPGRTQRRVAETEGFEPSIGLYNPITV